jgi:hypothetical protein
MRVILGLANIVVGRIIIDMKVNVLQILKYELVMKEMVENENQELNYRRIWKELLLMKYLL